MTRAVTTTLSAADSLDNHPSELFYRLLAEREYPYTTARAVESRIDMTDVMPSFEFAPKKQYFEGDGDNITTWVSDTHDIVALTRKSYNHYVILLAGRTKAELIELVETILGELPKIERKPPAVTTVPVYFWTHNGQRPESVRRDLDVPTWDEIDQNYPSHVREAIEKLVGVRMPKEDVGKLILWDGPPGGGKSFALRSLCREWQDWVDIHYITDPERFFGLSEYMMSVLLTGSHSMQVPVEPDDNPEDIDLVEDDDDGFGDNGPEVFAVEFDPVTETVQASAPTKYKHVSKYKLLIIEDAGEYLRSDASQRQGQSLSRLLNITDGMLGQGLKFLTLITTNEDIKHLHGATVRPGRCMAQIHFGPFSREQGQAWLKARGSDEIIPVEHNAASLGELYGIVNGNKQITTGEEKNNPGQYL